MIIERSFDMCSDNVLVLDKLVRIIEEDIAKVKEKSKLSYTTAEENEFHTPWNKSFVEKLKKLYQIMVPQVTRLRNEPENSEKDKEKQMNIYFSSKEEYNVRCAQNLGRFLQKAGDSFDHRYADTSDKEQVAGLAKWFGKEIIRWILS